MSGLIQMSAMLLGVPEEERQVEEFAKKLTSYTERDDEKAVRIRRLLRVLTEEVIPLKDSMGKEGFRNVMGEARKKILEVGGVTGFLSETGEKKG